MKISTKGRYALRLMLDIAVNSNGNPVNLKDIAARQDISDKYLEQIISTLNKAGLVRSIRGAQGGYVLTKTPGEYPVGVILKATEGDLSPVACLAGDSNTCERVEYCTTVKLYKMLDDAIKGVVDKVTLADMVEWQSETSNNYII